MLNAHYCHSSDTGQLRRLCSLLRKAFYPAPQHLQSPPCSSHGTWALGLSSFPSSLSKRAVCTRGTTKTFIECSGQAPPDPSAAEHTSGTGASARATASAHPTGAHAANLEVSRSFHREMLALVSLGVNVSPLWHGQGGKGNPAWSMN